MSLKQIEVVIRALPVFIFQSEDSLSPYYFAVLFTWDSKHILIRLRVTSITLIHALLRPFIQLTTTTCGKVGTTYTPSSKKALI